MPLHPPDRRRRTARTTAATAATASWASIPATGQTVWLKAGRFGPYVEVGEGEKPKRASLPKDWPPAAMDLDKALRLLRLPREVGAHPEDGKPILAGIGRYGPYVQHDGTYANLPSADEVFEVGLNRAVAVLAEKRAGGARRPRATAAGAEGARRPPGRRPAGARARPAATAPTSSTARPTPTCPAAPTPPR